MNDTDRDRFRSLIKARLGDLAEENQRGHDSQAIVALDQQSVGRLSRMDALQNQAMAKATQTRRNLEARRLVAALSRLDDGEFGYCDDCGDEIALKRLALDPAALLCITCAGR